MKAKLPKFSIKNRKTQVLLLVVTFIFVVFITQRDSPGIVAGIFLALVVIVVATTKQEKNLNTFGADGELRIRSVDERKLLL
jgi:MFS superfamily sulfate permease-like transporter